MTMFLIVLKLGLLREARLPLGVGVLTLRLLRSLRLVLRERVALGRRLGGHWGSP